MSQHRTTSAAARQGGTTTLDVSTFGSFLRAEFTEYRALARSDRERSVGWWTVAMTARRSVTVIERVGVDVPAGAVERL
jgi:hypothetical protein